MLQNVAIDSDKVLVSISGSIYVEEASGIRDNLLQYFDKGYNRYVIDLSEVDYIDSSGLGVLVSIQKRALQNGGGVAIKGLKGIVKELFELTRLTKVFEIVR